MGARSRVHSNLQDPPRSGMVLSVPVPNFIGLLLPNLRLCESTVLMVLRVVSFIPAAWAIFIAFYLDHLNKDPHKDDFGFKSTLVLCICIALLNLCIAVPIRGVRLVATLVFFGFVGVTFFSFGAWWFPGLVVAVVVTVLDWARRDVVQESEEI